MTTPVKFELAKLLKKKGFDKKVFNYFDTNYEAPSDIYCLGSFENWNIQPNLISAPTIAEVVMWLYEKYGILIYSFDEDCIKKTFGYHISLLNEEDKELYTFEHVAKAIVSGVNGMSFNSPTEAYEAAIEYCLTNLI